MKAVYDFKEIQIARSTVANWVFYSQFRATYALQSNSFKMSSLMHLLLYRSQVVFKEIE